MNRATVEVVSSTYPTGQVIYSGVVSQYAPYLSRQGEGIRVTLLGLSYLLSLAYYKNGSSYTVMHTTQDPSAILKAIIDHLNETFGLISDFEFQDGENFQFQDGEVFEFQDGERIITYDDNSVDSVGSNVSITFTDNYWLDALKTAAKAAGDGWYWYIDREGELHFHQKPSTATHAFTVEKDIELIDANITAEEIVNAVQVRYDTGTVDVSDSSSISSYFRREKVIDDQRLKSSDTATNRGNQEVNDNKVPKKNVILVVNSNYDIESIKPGDTCKIRNVKLDNGIFGDNMQIESIEYSFDSVRLELESVRSDIGVEVEKLVA